MSDTNLKTAAKKMSEYLNGQGENKPVESHPHEFREWEPTIKKMKERMKKAEQAGIDYLRKKYGGVIQFHEDGRVVQIDKDGNVTEWDTESKDKK